MNFKELHMTWINVSNGAQKYFVTDGKGFEMPYRDFYRQYIQGKMAETSFRRRLKYGQNVEDALAKKPFYAMRNGSLEATEAYLVKHLTKYGNTVLSAKKMKENELRELLARHGFICNIRLAHDNECASGEAKDYYVIEVLKCKSN